MATFQLLFFWLSANDIEIIFCPYMCIFIVKRCFARVFHYFMIFGFKNAKINFLKKTSISIEVFIELKYRRLQTHLANLKNTPDTWIFAYDRYFMIFFYKSSLSDIFENHQLHILESLYVFYFMLICLTKHITAWSAHFLTIFFSRLVSTFGYNVTL